MAGWKPVQESGPSKIFIWNLPFMSYRHWRTHAVSCKNTFSSPHDVCTFIISKKFSWLSFYSIEIPLENTLLSRNIEIKRAASMRFCTFSWLCQFSGKDDLTISCSRQPPLPTPGRSGRSPFTSNSGLFLGCISDNYQMSNQIHHPVKIPRLD